MRFVKFLDFEKYISPLKKMAPEKVKKELKDSWKKFSETISKEPELEKMVLNLINKKMKTNYKSLNQIGQQSIKESVELNEDFKHFWEWFEEQKWGAISIFPTLSIWFELDKLIDNFDLSSLNFKRIAIYGLMWLAMITGKHISMWKKWKKQNPEEWEKEGKPGPFTFKK